MNFSKLIAYPVWPDSINIQWELSNNELPGDYLFRVYLLKSSERIRDISGTLRNVHNYKWKYTSDILYTECRQLIKFEIVCTPPIINEKRELVQFSKIISMYHGLNDREFHIATEITRRENLRFKKQIGIRGVILKRKVSGDACTFCIDKLTRTSTTSSCPACFGTRFIGGYYAPDNIWLEVEEMPVIKQISDVSTTEEKNSRIRLSNEFLVNKKDIVVDLSNNNRWEIISEPEMVRYRTVPIAQKVMATMVSSKSVLNKIPVPGM